MVAKPQFMNKSWWRIAAASLAIGFILSFLVAWMAASWHPIIPVWGGVQRADADWPIAECDGWGSVTRIGWTRHGLGVTSHFFANELHGVQVVACGWPAKAFAFAIVSSTYADQWDARPAQGAWGGMANPLANSGWPLFRRIPFVPILPGALVNTLIIGGCTALAVVFSTKLWAGSRQRRGRCIGCGYHLGPIRVCPECGRSATREIAGTAHDETAATVSEEV
jgi:hypothetical protein